jgi:hypothetical protein
MIITDIEMTLLKEAENNLQIVKRNIWPKIYDRTPDSLMPYDGETHYKLKLAQSLVISAISELGGRK